MGIMTGKEEAWLRMMLEDTAMLVEMGLPLNMTDIEKDQVIETMMQDNDLMTQLGIEDGVEYTGMMGNHINFIEPKSEKLNNESACEWMVREAMIGMDYPSDILTPKSEIRGVDLEVGEEYQITFPNGNIAKVRLSRIMNSSLGDDYVFENLGGAEGLVNKSVFNSTNEFPLPSQLLHATIFHTLG